VLAPLAGGNTVILKTSEYSPTFVARFSLSLPALLTPALPARRASLALAHSVHMAVMQCLFDAGLPKGVLNVLHVATKDAPEVTQALIAHPVVRKVGKPWDGGDS
jgi:acyl-CoA reductase-like NAD-dependent aldehyde dehydrogenase